MSSNTSQKKRTGSLYRRLKGKDYGIDDPAATGGTIWLQYRLHGKMTRISLKTSDVKAAEEMRTKIMDPLRSADQVEASAQLALKASQAQQHHDAILLMQNPPLSVTNAWEAYLSSHERPDSGDATLGNYTSQWKRFKGWHDKQYPDSLFMKDVTPKVASAYASDLTKAKFTPNTFNKHINLVRLVFETLLEAAQIETNPFGKIKRKKLKTQSKRELTKHELKTILETAKGDLKTLLYIGTFTGMRLGDCATLRWGEVDMDDLIIKRVPNKTSSNSKPIIIGIPNALYELLNNIPKSKRRGYVLTDIANSYHKDASGLTDRIQKHFINNGIQTHKEGTGYIKVPIPGKPDQFEQVHTGKRAVVEVGFHSLRHTFVSLHATMGTAQAVIQAIVGHGNPAMTAHYTHIGKEAAKQAAGALPDPTAKQPTKDAEFEVVEDKTVPSWILEQLKSMSAENWKSVRDGIVGGQLFSSIHHA